MPVFIPDLFSSYIQGRRNAIQDNWTDLKDYNEVLKGQLSNAYDMETFDSKVRQSRNNALVSNMNTALGAMTTDQALLRMAKEIQMGVPLQQAMANYYTALNSQKQAQFNNKALEDPQYYDNTVNPKPQGTATGGGTTAGAGTDGGVNTAAPAPIQTINPFGSLQEPANYKSLNPSQQAAVQALANVGNMTQEDLNTYVDNFVKQNTGVDPNYKDPLQQ